MMSLALIGYRGSGKTTVGKLLAQRLGVPFVDTDLLIARAAGVSIRDIFACVGQPYFLELEQEALEQAIATTNAVVSTGGGIVLRPENRERLRSSARPIIYLASTPELLLARIQSDPQSAANRPNLTTLGGGLEEIREVLRIRDPLYRETATLVIDAAQSPETIADAIEQTMKEQR